jgi:hypothetical protein
MVMAINNTKYNLDMSEQGFEHEELEAKVIVLSRILKEHGIDFKVWYTRKSKRSYKRARKPNIEWSDLNVIFEISSDESYIKYILWIFNQRMNNIIHLNKSFQLEPNT